MISYRSYKHTYIRCDGNVLGSVEGARGRRRRRRTSREPEPSVLRISQSPLRGCAGTSVWICPDRVTRTRRFDFSRSPFLAKYGEAVRSMIQDDDGDTMRGRRGLKGWFREMQP